MASAKSIYINKEMPQKQHLFFVVLYGSYFLLGHFYCKCNLQNPLWYSTKQERTVYYERFLSKLTNKYCYKGLIASSRGKEI